MQLKTVGGGAQPQSHPAIRRAPVQSFVKAALNADHVAAAEIALAFMAKVQSRTAVIVDLFDASQQYISQRWRVGTATSMDEYHVSQAIEAACEALPRAPSLRPTNHAPRALLLTVRSEQHNLGLHLLAMAFADSGWIVTAAPEVEPSDVLQLIWRVRPSLVAISATYDSGNLRAQLKAMVRQVTERNIPILVGGSAFIRAPELAAEIGGALFAPDARVAVIMARKMGRKHRRHAHTTTL